MTAKEIRREIRALKAYMKAKGVKRSSFMNGGHSVESYRCNAHLFELETQLKAAGKEAPLTGDKAVLDRMVRKHGGGISVGACRGCGGQGGYGLAEYERQDGKAPKVELCYLCDDCRKRLGGIRLRFRLVYQPVWPDA